MASSVQLCGIQQMFKHHALLLLVFTQKRRGHLQEVDLWRFFKQLCTGLVIWQHPLKTKDFWIHGIFVVVVVKI